LAQTEQQVAGLESRLGRRGILDHAADQHTVLVAGALKERLRVEAEPTSPDAACCHELLGYALGQVAGDSASQTVTDFVDADNLAMQVHQRPTGVPAVDRGVVPDPTHQRADVFAVQSKAPGRTPEPRH